MLDKRKNNGWYNYMYYLPWNCGFYLQSVEADAAADERRTA
jgi:hypothetical protein